MEKIKNIVESSRIRLGAVIVLGGAALMGCGGGSGEPTEPVVGYHDDIPPSAEFDGVDIRAEVFSNGTRIIRTENDGYNFSDIVQFCDGPDLMEQTSLNIAYKAAAGNAPIRSVDHAACEDGRLTEADFSVPR